MSNHKVTDITETKKGRFALMVDGKFLCSLSLDDLVRCDLGIGKEISRQDMEYYMEISGIDKCRSKAIHLLSFREHGAAELRTKLLRTFDPHTADKVVEEMASQGLVDDRRFGQLFAAELYRTKHYGPMRIAEELSRRGVSRQDVQWVMDQCAFDFEASAALVLEEKYGDWRLGKKERLRAVNGMYRLGYAASITMGLMGRDEDLE